ncbi:MAG: TonB-dependent receptor [Bryobacterales bacterium]|nr:TonB-dependent receptor [Bryobacterales bacterium]MBV9397912.1 TonB-dependent receptor [Bryobacterales bacterium]
MIVALLLVAVFPLFAGDAGVKGTVADLQGKGVADATIRLERGRDSRIAETHTDAVGGFSLTGIMRGNYRLVGSAPSFDDISQTIALQDGATLTVELKFDRLAARNETVNVTADVKDLDILNPDPAQRIVVREEILDANPGRPGAPVSIPGLPIETASGGLKAPQYFAPGVAGDHGEPIASFIRVGSFFMPNNLSANAHGNGYSDPNILVPAVIESVQTDGGAFNVREGNHSVDLGATYGLRTQFEPFATLTADYRDVDLSAGCNWLAGQVSYGNGFLDALEHRQQYKFNVLKTWNLAAHNLTLLGIGYYGESKVPGLTPIDVPNLHDTIDPRQRDQTHTGEIAVNDIWHRGPTSELQLSSFFRAYNLSLYSNFGDGLIRQSEFRTVTGSNATYIKRVNRRLSVMAGLDYLREAPRRDNLDNYFSTDPAFYGPFEKITANNITLNFVTPFVALDGSLTSWLRYNVGWRRDQIEFDNTDLLTPENSFSRWIGINSPKATLALVAPDSLPFPSVSLSFGQAFFTNDPRIGTGTQQGSLTSQAHAYQAVVSKSFGKTDIRVTLGHITQEASLAKIDPDTGLQFDEGPSRNRFLTISARHYFAAGLLQASVSKADARDLSDGTPIPEAPRLIVDVLGTVDRLPFHLQARAEFEEVGRKPLGDGFISVPVREFRGALVRQFLDGKLDAGVHFQIASGYTGQTTEILALPGESDPFERVVGVYLPSYATVSAAYHFRRQPPKFRGAAGSG